MVAPGVSAGRQRHADIRQLRRARRYYLLGDAVSVSQALPGDFDGFRDGFRGASGASGATAPPFMEATWWYFGSVDRLPLRFDDFARFAMMREYRPAVRGRKQSSMLLVTAPPCPVVA